ncbi:MAG: hypothetical protein IPK97_16335 [Ahniella sp.]|nr:hypothetical protein [Ahniella sp.]
MNSSESAPNGSGALPFDPAQALRAGLRVRQCDFARLIGVSKAAVSGYIRRGLIDRPGPDGRLDPVAASAQLLKRGDPVRLRAPLLRRAAESVADAQGRADTMSAHVDRLTAELESEREFRQARCLVDDELCRRLDLLQAELIAGFDRLAEARAVGRLFVELQCMIGAHVWQLPDSELTEFRSEAMQTGQTDADMLAELRKRGGDPE